MNLKKIIPVLFMMSMLLMASCEQESITTSETKTAVVAGYLFAGQPANNIRITKSTSYAAKDTTLVTLDDLGVKLSDGTSTYVLSPKGSGYYSKTNLVFQSEKTYSIEFEYNGKTVSAQTFVPAKKKAALSTTEIQMQKMVPGTFPGGGGFGTILDPIEVSWKNEERDYYYVVVENVEINPEYVNDAFASPNNPRRNFTFISEPQIMNFYNIDPRREVQQFGKHRVVVYRVNPEYAALYKTSGNTSLSLSQPPSNVKNGLGIFTGVASDTLFFQVTKI